jgi:hypothetical protein
VSYIVTCDGKCADRRQVTEFDPATTQNCPVCNWSWAFHYWRNPDGTVTPWYPALDVKSVRDPNGNWKRGTWLGHKLTHSGNDLFTTAASDATIAIDFVNAQAQITIGRESAVTQQHCDVDLPIDLLDALQAVCHIGTRNLSKHVPVLILRWLNREDLIEQFAWSAS